MAPTYYQTKFLGFLSSDPDPTTIEEGSWWYNTTEKRWKYYDGSEIKDLPTVIKKASVTVTIPIGGGLVTTSLSAADFGLTKIERILDVVVHREAPVVPDVYAPSYGINATSDGVGITLGGGTGTTLRVEVTVSGY